MWVVWCTVAFFGSIFLESIGFLSDFSAWDNFGWIVLVLWLVWAFIPSKSKKDEEEHELGDYP